MKREELLSLRPRMLRTHMAVMLDMPVEEIPDGAFRAWLGRYRKANGPIAEKKEPTGIVIHSDEAEVEIDDWRKFQPSKPVPLNNYDIKSILRPVVDNPED